MSLRIGIGLGIIPSAARPGVTTAPVNVVKPFFAGILTQGQSADVDPGTWTGLPSPNFTYAIKRGATTVSTDPDYVWTAADVAAGASAMTVAVTATNDVGPTAETSDPVTIAAPLAISGTPPAATVGVPYSHTFTFTGGHAPRMSSLDGTPPAGLTYNGTTHTLAGTPLSSGTAGGLAVDGVDADGLTTSFGPFDLAVGSDAPGSDISSLEIMDGTALDPSAVADAGNGIGVDGNGWVAVAVMPYLAATTFDPTKISLEVSDPGYDASGTTTVTRTITGRAILRRQYPNNASLLHSNDGTDYTVYFSLSDDIYAGSTIISATAASGFYGAAADGAVGSVQNNATLAYPKPLFAWLNLQHERAGAGGLAVEAVAAHQHARNGRQVARIDLIAKDAQVVPNVAATQVAAAPSLSAFQTQGQIVEAYKATIPVTALTQGDICQVNAKVYPWIGDASAVLDLEVDGLAWPTANPQTPLRFLNDKTGGYGGAHVAVKAGAVGGTVQSSYASAITTPFPTVNAALAALPAWNNTNKGHSDHSGAIVWFMDDGAGGAVAHAPTANMGSIAVGKCWTEMRVDPAATGAVSLLMSATRTVPSLLRWMLPITHTAGNGLDGGASTPNNVMVAHDGNTITYAGSGVMISYRCGLIYQRNVTISGMTGASQHMMSGQSTNRIQTALALGVLAEDSTVDSSVQPFALIGCRFKRMHLIENNYASVPAWDSQDGMFVQNTLFRDVRAASVLGNRFAYVRGLALLQNVFERANVGSSPALQLGADSTVQPMANVVMAYNTIPGETSECRFNVAYTDVAGSVGVKKTVTLRFNLVAEYNTKRDPFATVTTVSGRVGTWRNGYTVSHLGNVSVLGSAGGSAPNADGSTWLGEAWPAATYNVGAGSVTYTNDQTGASNPGGGTYTLTGGSNAAYDAVPAGMAGLGKDLAGITRMNDGNGAAGAYERTV